MPQPLSSKESSLFRQVVKNYEGKQYKKGLKAADQILRKSPNHGDTQAMKALILNSLGQSEEAFALAKTALKSDMKSHVCWHVYGLLWRSAKNFEEAIKAYKFALKIEPESAQILRDLALLQIQMRDYQGYILSRKTILQGRPQLRQNWTAMAVAHHLAGELHQAEKVLTTYEDTLKNPPPKTDIEHAEAVLYKNKIIAEMGEIERALDHLEAVQKSNPDRTAVMELRAHYLLQLGRKQDAEKAYRDLLDRNAEYRKYYEGLEESLSLDRTRKAELKELYEFYAQKSEKIDAARRIPLDFLEGEEFRSAADHYLRRMLQKGVPSTFNNVKALYSDPSKKGIIEELVHGYESEKHMNGSTESQPNGEKPDPFAESVLFFLAQHYNYKRSRNLKRALEYVDKLMEMSPKTYDYPMTKARILKHSGNITEAARIMNEAREIDLKDRYINTKCAKYQLRNNENDVALKTMSKFTRNETVGGTLGDLMEMQCLWYLTEDGEAYWRVGKLGLALKRFHSIFDIFETWQEDQFDFHAFSLRKGQIRAYIDMIRWEDSLRKHPYYIRMALSAVKIYISLHDDPNLAKQDGAPNGLDHMDEAERKKALKKVKKEQEKQEKEDAARREADKKAAAKRSNAADGEVKKVDQDPRGVKLLETTEPLEASMKFLNPLLEFGDDNAEIQHVGFDVFVRRRKYFLALKCLLASFHINKDDPIAHEQALRFRAVTKQNPTDSTPTVLELANENLPAPYNDANASLVKINDEFLAKHSESPLYVFAAVRARQYLDESSKSKNEDAITDTLANCKDMTLDDALVGVQTLKDIKVSKAAVDKFVARSKERWPEAVVVQIAAER